MKQTSSLPRNLLGLSILYRSRRSRPCLLQHSINDLFQFPPHELSLYIVHFIEWLFHLPIQLLDDTFPSVCGVGVGDGELVYWRVGVAIRADSQGLCFDLFELGVNGTVRVKVIEQTEACSICRSAKEEKKNRK